MEQKKPSNKLAVPEGVASTGPVMDIAEAYTRAIIALPEILEDIADSLGMIALVCERKGKAEMLITDEDLEKGDRDGKGPEAA